MRYAFQLANDGDASRLDSMQSCLNSGNGFSESFELLRAGTNAQCATKRRLASCFVARRCVSARCVSTRRRSRARPRPHNAYWPVNFCSTWLGRRSALFRNGGLIAGDKASTYRQSAQRHKNHAPGNVFPLAVELLFTLAVARARDSGQGTKMP